MTKALPTRRLPIRRLLVILVLAAGLAGSVARAQDGGAEDTAGAQHFVSHLATKAIRVMTGGGLTDAERSRQFRTLFLDAADMHRIGKLVLGRYWRLATAGQRDEFLKLFTDLVVRTWANRFKNTSGAVHLHIVSAAPAASGGVLVESMLRRQNQTPIRVGWRLRKVEGKWRIYDLEVAGTSMIATYRDEYASVIAGHGGSVAALNKALRNKLEQLSQSP